MRLTSIRSLFLAALLVASTAHATGPAALAPADGTLVRGVVTKVVGGRVTLREDGGHLQTFSSKPGTVKEGQRIQAVSRRFGDSIRLERVEVQR